MRAGEHDSVMPTQPHTCGHCVIHMRVSGTDAVAKAVLVPYGRHTILYRWEIFFSAAVMFREAFCSSSCCSLASCGMRISSGRFGRARKRSTPRILLAMLGRRLELRLAAPPLPFLPAAALDTPAFPAPFLTRPLCCLLESAAITCEQSNYMTSSYSDTWTFLCPTSMGTGCWPLHSEVPCNGHCFATAGTRT